tara:strand:- start:329 stop:673 length:345 start_codon:yes stop_codon:yes gene_type:complete
MGNEVWNVLIIYGDKSHMVADELYNKYSKYDCGGVQWVQKNITMKHGNSYASIKLYSSWNPIHKELVDLSLKYKLWIKNTFYIECRACGEGVIVVDNGETLANARYYDHEQDFN